MPPSGLFPIRIYPTSQDTGSKSDLQFFYLCCFAIDLLNTEMPLFLFVLNFSMFYLIFFDLFFE